MIKDTYGERIRFSGPDILINPVAAQQISLAVHELATNTHKYGLGASEQASVNLTWSAKDHVFELIWEESNISRTEFATGSSEGFGTKLLTTIIPATLDGTAERHIQSGRYIYRLRLPLGAIVSAKTAQNDASLAARIIEDSYDV